MTGLHAHLMLNHIPVVGVVAAAALTAWALRRPALRRAALITAAIAGLSAVPAFMSGEPAEDAVETEQLEPYIERHEEAAGAALAAALVTAALAAAVLYAFRFRDGVPRWAMAAVAVALLVQTALMLNAARLGGQIAHPELRTPPAAGPSGGAPAP